MKGMRLRLRVSVSEQFPVLRRDRRVVVRINYQNPASPRFQVFRRKQRPSREVEQDPVLMSGEFPQTVGGDRFVQIRPPELELRVFGVAQRRKKNFVEPQLEQRNK